MLDTRLRYVLGQRTSPFSVSDVLEGKIVLVRLPLGLLGTEPVRAIGLLVLAVFRLAAQQRTDNQPAHIFIKDVHHFDSTILMDMLASMPDYHVAMHILHQHLGQLSAGTREAILGTVKDKYFFRISKKDTMLLNEITGPDNVNIELYKLSDDEGRRFNDSGYENVVVGPLSWRKSKTISAKIRTNVIRNYTVPLASARVDIDRFISDLDSPPPIHTVKKRKLGRKTDES
jgi:hypothetical protein